MLRTNPARLPLHDKVLLLQCIHELRQNSSRMAVRWTASSLFGRCWGFQGIYFRGFSWKLSFIHEASVNFRQSLSWSVRSCFLLASFWPTVLTKQMRRARFLHWIFVGTSTHWARNLDADRSGKSQVSTTQAWAEAVRVPLCYPLVN